MLINFETFVSEMSNFSLVHLCIMDLHLNDFISILGMLHYLLGTIKDYSIIALHIKKIVQCSLHR